MLKNIYLSKNGKILSQFLIADEQIKKILDKFSMLHIIELKGGSVLVVKECPMCHTKSIKFYVKYGFDVDFNIQNSNQNIICPNCKRKISYSVQKMTNKP